MSDPRRNPGESPLRHPDEQAAGGDGAPKFGRLLLVLILVVLLVGVITFASEAFYS